jgi:hypothetical protein
MVEEPIQYKMIGADGVEYGPAAAAEVAEWIRERRASAKTLVRKTSEPNWRKLEEFPEFASELAAKAQTLQAGAATALPAGPPKNKLARMSFTLSLVSMLCWCPPLAPVGLVMSVISLYRIRTGKDLPEGFRFALAGVCITLTSLIANLVLLHYIPRLFGK